MDYILFIKIYYISKIKFINIFYLFIIYINPEKIYYKILVFKFLNKFNNILIKLENILYFLIIYLFFIFLFFNIIFFYFKVFNINFNNINFIFLFKVLFI